MLRSIALLAAITSTLSACAFSKNEPPPPTPPSTADQIVSTIKKARELEAVDGKLTIDNVEITFKEIEEPNTYKLIVRWPKSIPQMALTLNSKPMMLVNGTDQVELSVLGDEAQSLNLVAYGAVSAAPLSTLQIETRSPKDLVIRKTVELGEYTTYKVNRVFFEPGGQIVTNGFGLMIHTKKFVVSKSDRTKDPDIMKSAQIRTHLLNAQSRDPNDVNLKGSEITINAEEASGTLEIAMIGVKGTPGAPGVEREKHLSHFKGRTPMPSDASKNGRDGIAQPSELQCARTEDRIRECRKTVAVCLTHPEHGKDGDKGDKGTQGEQGARGGNAGTLRFNIGKSDQLLVSVRYKTGAGGPGGPGAPGFPGKLGGKGGANPAPCNKSLDGAQGGVGDKGDEGPPGDRGSGPTIEGGSVRVESAEL